MERVVVVGTSCSGKTTLAHELADAIGAAHVELDALHWGPNWSEAPLDDFRERVRERVTTDRWVVDGNYTSVRDIVWPKASDAIWLNYSFPVVAGRALSRTIRRVFLQEELFSGNRETFRDQFLSRGSILWWVLTTFHRRRRQYRELFGREEFGHLRVTELRTPQETEEFLRSISRVGSASRSLGPAART